MEHKLHKKGHLLSEKEQLIEIFTEDLNSEHSESNSFQTFEEHWWQNFKIYIVMEDFPNGNDVKNEDQTANSRKWSHNSLT